MGSRVAGRGGHEQREDRKSSRSGVERGRGGRGVEGERQGKGGEYLETVATDLPVFVWDTGCGTGPDGQL